MKIVSAVEARKNFGHLLNLVSLTHTDVLIERAGKKIARLTSVVNPELPLKLDLRKAKGLGKEVWADIHADEYVEKERAQWE